MHDKPFDPVLYRQGLRDAMQDNAPTGYELDHTYPSYTAGVLNGTRVGGRTAVDGQAWDARTLGRHLGAVAQTLELAGSSRALQYAIAQVLPADVEAALGVITGERLSTATNA